MKEQTSERASRIRVLTRLQKNIRFHFRDQKLLEHALTHRSFSNETGFSISDNERLEYLGDSVLGLVVNEYLYKRFVTYHEGDLAKIKSAVVSEEMLASLARDLQLGEYLLLGRGEEHSGGRDRDSILANTLEALIGAMYLDSGLIKTKKFILFLIKPHIEKVNNLPYLRDPKTALQEMVQKKYKEKPVYELVSETGPDHQKEFVVRLMINGRKVIEGFGKSKRRAEMDAARKVLEKTAKGDLKI